MTIVVEVKNEILGNSEFWRGDESRIAEIRNIPARETAKQVAADGKPRVCGMWHVRQELRPNEAATVRTLAVPLDLLPAAGRGPCQGCDYRAPAPRCAVMRSRAVSLGLPDCAGGFVFKEVVWQSE